MSVAAAIQYCQSRSTGVRDLVHSLRRVSEVLTLLALYRKYFPAEFGSELLNWWQPDTLYRACSNFIWKVDSRLFPVRDSFDWMEAEEADLGDIYIYEPFPHWSEDPESLNNPLLLAMLQALGYVDETGRESDVTVHPWRSGFDWNKLRRECATLKPKVLRDLPVAVSFVEKASGNIWVDITEEELIYASDWPAWSEENIEWLRKDWQEALKIKAAFDRLQTWAGGRQDRLDRIKRLIAAALIQREQTRVRVTTGGALYDSEQDIRVGAPLVEVLGEQLDEDDEAEDFDEWDDWEE